MRLALAALSYLGLLWLVGIVGGGAVGAAIIASATRRARRIVEDAEARAVGIEDRALALAERALDVDRLSDAASRASGGRPALHPPRRR